MVGAADLRLTGDDEKNGDVEVGSGAQKKRGSVGRTAHGWKRYLGVLYTMLSTNSFSLSSTVLKKYSHIHPFTLGVWAFPLAAVFSIPFIVYTLRWEKKSVTDTFWPIRQHKKVVFFIWVGSHL